MPLVPDDSKDEKLPNKKCEVESTNKVTTQYPLKLNQKKQEFTQLSF